MSKKQLLTSPIFVKNIEEIQNLKLEYSKKQQISYKCSVCGTLKIIKLENFWFKNEQLFCTRCLKRKSWKEKDTKAIQKKKENTLRKRLGRNYKEILSQKLSQTLQNKSVIFWEKRLQKQTQTCLNRYGVENPGAAKQAREKAKQTTLQKYGVEYFNQSSEYQKERREKTLEKYGVENTLQLDFVKQKRKETLLKRYGVSNPLKNPEIEKKRENTLKQRYGRVRNLTGQYSFEDQIFDSSWELAVWIWARKNNVSILREPCSFEYSFEGKIHHYTPDFLIENILVEIKGNQFFENNKMINPFDRSQDSLMEAKHQCALQNNVEFWDYRKLKNIIKYVENMYGKDWKTQFKRKEN